MGIVLGFAPWIVYWVLVGNVPFHTAVLVALAIAVLSFAIGRTRGAPGSTLEIGAVATFLVLTVLTFTLSESFMERWIQPLSNAGIFLVALTGVLIGKPFVREFAEVDQPKEVVESELFRRITTLLTWIWVAAFAGMTVSSAIPPIVQGDATILDTKTPLSVRLLLGHSVHAAGSGGTRVADPARTDGPAPEDLIRKTTFVAFAEAEIDQADLPRHRTRQP